MAEQIGKHAQTLARQGAEEWEDSEKLRREFVAKYPVARIRQLALDDYVIGKGAGNRSFCYRLEREMDRLGRILGSPSPKFGVYFGKKGKDPERKYRFVGHWGATLEDAFAAVKQAIVSLLEDAGRGDLAAVAANRLSPMFKGKLLFVYHPEQFAPIYAREHLEHFAAALDLHGAFRSEVEMQRALMDYRATWPELSAQPALLYMRLLYLLFDYPPEKEDGGGEGARVPLLDVAAKGAEFIEQMPAISSEERGRAERRGKIDYEAQQRQFKRIGDRGEALVVEIEKRRLLSAGRRDLAERIVHTAQEDDSAGYDILSFDEDGTERPIEVKATSGANLGRGFYISANEVEQSSSLSNYHLYLVFSALSKKPRILSLRQPDLQGGAFTLRPVVFHAILPAHRNEP